MAKGKKGKQRGKKGKEPKVKKEPKKKVEVEVAKDPEAIPFFLSAEQQDSKALDVIVEDYSLNTPTGVPLISLSELRIVQGRRYGLIGRNGIGKSTLLHAIVDGNIKNFPPQLHVMCVEQEVKPSDKLVLEYVMECDYKRQRLQDYEKELLDMVDNDTAPDNLDYQLELLYEKMEEMQLHESEKLAKTILEGLCFTPQQMKMKTCDLSGGWRMRVAIACALFVAPDILLLDEPTNHLDFPAVIWLQRYLQEYEKSLIVVSHDRTFLNDVITDVIDFRDLKITYYKGNYQGYIKTREDMLKDQVRRYEAQQKQIEKMKAFIERFKSSEKESTLVQSRIKELKRMEMVEPVREEKLFRFSFPEAEKLKSEESLFRVRDMTFDYAGKDVEEPLLKDVNLFVDLESRIAVLGHNGVGKSTLLKLVLGKLEPTKGKCKINEYARVCCFTQHHMDQLKLDLSPLEYFQEMFPLEKDLPIRNHLGRLGVTGGLALQKMATLSGGQKSRVAFSVITFKQPHLLILDEPTNHLDIETIDALLEAVKDFKGGVVMVSHDQYFLQNCAKSYWGVNHGEVKEFYEFEEAQQWSYAMPEVEIREDPKAAKKAAKMAQKKAAAREAAEEAAALNIGKTLKKKK